MDLVQTLSTELSSWKLSFCSCYQKVIIPRFNIDRNKTLKKPHILYLAWLYKAYWRSPQQHHKNIVSMVSHSRPEIALTPAEMATYHRWKAKLIWAYVLSVSTSKCCTMLLCRKYLCMFRNMTNQLCLFGCISKIVYRDIANIVIWDSLACMSIMSCYYASMK